MTKDKDDKDARLYDVRVVERNIQKGLITRKDLDKHLKGLPDLRDKARHPADEAGHG